MAGKCGHSACTCVVTGQQSGYCSDYCSELGHQTQSDGCDCGHDACTSSGKTG